MKDEVLESVRELTAERLGLTPEAVDVDSTFAMLGGDSLSMVSLVRRVEGRFGARVTLRSLFDGNDTPRKLAHALTTPESVVTPAADPAPATVPVEPPAEPYGLYAAQLKLAEDMVDKVTALMARQLDTLAGGAPPAAEPSRTPVVPLSTPALPGMCDFSLYFFGDYPDPRPGSGYDDLVEAAEFADRNGFHTLWMPERHFNSFGALFPNPSVLAAALATRTSRIRLHAGSVVLPLHNPIRVAEEWSMVDNLSRGRAGLCVASGWHAHDFALAPDNFGRHRELMHDQLATVRSLWAGKAIPATSGTGEAIEVRLHPRPVQPEPPLFVAVVGNPDSYRRAAREGLGIVTNLMSQTVAQLAENIALYRRTRAEHGLAPEAGRVVVLVHSYVGDDLETVRREAAEPFKAYLRSSLHLLADLAGALGIHGDLAEADEGDVSYLLDEAYERYCADRALIGTVESCRPIVEALVAAGADELACFIDFGLPGDRMLTALPALARLRAQEGKPGRGKDGPGVERRRPEPAVPISPAQRRLWIVEQMYPGRADYWEPKGLLLEGELDRVALQGALDRVIARHPQLRSTFHESAGRVTQEFAPPAPVLCPLIDLPGLPAEEAFARLAGDLREATPDLAQGPPFLARLAELGGDRHLLFLLAHHIVFDSFSTAVFARDLAAFYRAWPETPADLPGLPALRAPEARAEDLDFWVRELDGAQVLALPEDHPGAARRGRGVTRSSPPGWATPWKRGRGSTAPPRS